MFLLNAKVCAAQVLPLTKAVPGRLPKNALEMAHEGGKHVQCCDLTQMLT